MILAINTIVRLIMTLELTSRSEVNPNLVLFKAFNNACSELSISRDQAGKVLGVDKATLSRNKNKGFDPNSKTGELCLHFVRVYRSLYAISGGDNNFMRHWLSSHNTALGDSPLNLIFTIVGLIRVNEYLDAMRGKV